MNARLFFTTLLGVGALAAPAPAGAIVNGEPPAADETRYDAIGALGFAARVGLEGPLPTPDDTWHCTATLIAPNLVLTARHCLLAGREPVDPTTLALVFRRNPDGSLGATDPSAPDRGLSSFHRVRVSAASLPDSGYDDVALVELVEPVEHITPLSVAIWGALLEEGSPIRMAGWGREGPAASDPQTGLRICDTVSGSWLGTLAAFPPASAAPCGPASHDSGAPILVESATGEERILAIVTATSFGERLDTVAELPQLSALTHVPWSGVDVSVASYSHELRYFAAHEEIEVEVTLRNAGNTSSGDVNVELALREPGATPRRQTLTSQRVPGVDANSVASRTLRFRPPPYTAPSLHRLEVRVSAAGDVLASNDAYLTLRENARFYVSPRVLAYRDFYFAFLHGEDAILGALAVYERGDGSIAALVTGPGRAVALEHPALGEDRTLELAAFTAEDAPLTLGLTLPVHPVGERITGSEPIEVTPAVVDGATSRDDRFANIVYTGSANHGAGRYVGAFLDGAHEPISAMALPSRNVVLVVPDLAAPNASYMLALPDGDDFEWRVSGSIASSLAVDARQRFDIERDQYVTEGTLTTSEGVERPFLLVREASVLGEGDRCHDDAECVAAGLSRCAPELWQCTNEPPMGEQDAGPAPGGDAGVPVVPDAGAGGTMGGGGGCSVAERSGTVPAVPAVLVAGLALVALRLRRRR